MTVTVSVVVWIGIARSMVSVWPTCNVKSVRTTRAKPVLLAVIW